MSMDFKAATDALFAKTGADELAIELGCSSQTIKQARLASGTFGRRTPPPDWEAAAARLARRKAAALLKLADKLA